MTTLWLKMAESCPFFLKEFGDTVNKTWFDGLAEFMPDQILEGYEIYSNSGFRGVPSLSQFKAWCRPVVQPAAYKRIKPAVKVEVTESNKAMANTVLAKLKGQL